MTVLIVDDDVRMLERVGARAEARGYAVVRAASFEAAAAAIDRTVFAAAIVDLHLGGETGLEIVRRLQARDARAEAIVVSADGRLSSALESYAHNIFAFVPKPADPGHLVDTLARALERRRIAVDNARLLWELQLLNVAGEIISSSLDLSPMLDRTLAHLVPAFDASWGMVRLRRGGRADAPPIACHNISLDILEQLRAAGAGPGASDLALRSGRVVRWHDAREDLPAAAALFDATRTRALMAVPIPSGGEMVGTLSIGAPVPGRFAAEDERVMMTFARQLGVAVANAELYGHVQRAKAEWERTFDAIGDAIAVYDAGGRIVRANRAMLAMHQWSWEGIENRTCADAGLCGGGDACAVTTAARRRLDVRSHVTLPDGRTFDVTTFPAGGSGGDRAAVVQVAHDVTERMAAAARIESMRQQLLQAEKLSALGQLVAGVAHELNNPLTSVIGYAQLVQEALTDDRAGQVEADLLARVGGDVAQVLAEAERAARIVRNLLAFARQQSVERRPRDIGAVVQTALSLRDYSLRQRGIDVRFRAEPGLPEIVSDAGQMQQVIVNLVLNAEHAMRAAPAPVLTVTLSAEPDAGAVRIEVSDTGHGIDPSTLPRIFDPFFTTRPVGEGTGLGLSICYGIIREHGGTLLAASPPGGPTRFTIRLPAVDPASAARFVLVAHVDPAMRAHLAALFTGWGHRTVSAGTARDARHALDGQTPAIAVLDRSVLDVELPAWRDLIAPFGGLQLIVGTAPGPVGASDPVAAFAASRGAVLVPAPYDMRALRDALIRGEQV